MKYLSSGFNTPKHTFYSVCFFQNRVGGWGVQLTTQAPKTLFFAQNWHCYAILFGEKCLFYGGDGPETPTSWLQCRATH